MRRFAFPLVLAGTFAMTALGAHTMTNGSAEPRRVVDVRNSADDPSETPAAVATPDAPDDSDGRAGGGNGRDDSPDPTATPSADGSSTTPSASETPDAPDDSDGRSGNDDDSDEDDNNGSGGDDDDRSGSNSGKG